MRSRNLRPGFFRDEDMVGVPFEYRLLYEGLWCLADVEGRVEDRPLRIKADIFPYDDVDIVAGLDKLVEKGKVQRYEVEGRKLLWLPNLAKHQAFSTGEKQDGSELPPPPALKAARKASKGQTKVRPKSDSGHAQDSLLTCTPLTCTPVLQEPTVADRVLARLNELRGGAGKGYQASPELNARISEGVPEADLMLVVESKVPDLLTFKNGKFCRPKTLFGPQNFAAYLQDARAGPAREVKPPRDVRHGRIAAEDSQHIAEEGRRLGPDEF